MARTFFNTIDDVRAFITVDISQKTDTILPYFEQAHKFVRDLLSEAYFNQLLDYYHATTPTPDADMDTLLPYVQLAVANFGYHLAVPKLNVSIGENGIGVVSNNNLAPASRERVEALEKSLEASGYDALEEMINYIEKNPTKYAVAYTSIFSNRFFINSATEINNIFSSYVRHVDYIRQKPTVFLIEQRDIYPVVGSTLFTELKNEIKVNTYTGNNQKYVENYIRPACACRIYALIYPAQATEFNGEATRYIDLLRQEIETDTNPDVSPTTYNQSGFIVL